MLPVAVARSSFDDSAIRYVLPVFLDGVKFSYNRANGQELKTALCFVEFARWWHRGGTSKLLSTITSLLLVLSLKPLKSPFACFLY